jgi:transposase
MDMNLSQKLRSISLDIESWQRLFYKNQQVYIRQRLLAIKHLSEGKKRKEVSQILGCTDLTLANWIQKYVDGGLDALVEPIKHNVTSSLNDEQRQELRKIILNERPTKYGVDREIWTGEIISEVIKQLWNVELKTSRIYEILAELRLSYQKTHRDYANASPEAQKEFVEVLKKKWTIPEKVKK